MKKMYGVFRVRRNECTFVGKHKTNELAVKSAKGYARSRRLLSRFKPLPEIYFVWPIMSNDSWWSNDYKILKPAKRNKQVKKFKEQLYAQAVARNQNKDI